MTKKQIDKAILTLKRQGYAVVIFTPEELNGAESGKVEGMLIELGWDIISDLKPEADDTDFNTGDN
jgi:hypothetical protein